MSEEMKAPVEGSARQILGVIKAIDAAIRAKKALSYDVDRASEAPYKDHMAAIRGLKAVLEKCETEVPFSEVSESLAGLVKGHIEDINGKLSRRKTIFNGGYAVTKSLHWLGTTGFYAHSGTLVQIIRCHPAPISEDGQEMIWDSEVKVLGEVHPERGARPKREYWSAAASEFTLVNVVDDKDVEDRYRKGREVQGG